MVQVVTFVKSVGIHGMACVLQMPYSLNNFYVGWGAECRHNQQLLHEIEILPPELQKQKQLLKKRTVGEYRDKIVIHDDFDTPLPDDFWLGE
ncbi:hypothetical protein [Crenothrix sp.]|uniref:hypothetical protein n=1 Tax=Crenothrix sp. TaxID=3100433 RepID=UPI00374CB89E